MHNRDNLHRAALLLIDLNKAQTIDEATAILNRYRLTVAVGKEASLTESGQACLLTILNTAVRACVGGVYIVGIDGSEPLSTPLGSGLTLGQSIRRLGGQICSEAPGDTPVILIGDCRSQPPGEPILRATYGGWSGGIVSDEMFRLAEDSIFPPAAIFAGALAVSECFSFLLGSSILAGYRSMGLSLYDPRNNWRSDQVAHPLYLPAALWLLGLGHLGQAYAWTLAALPYSGDHKPLIYLHDNDIVTTANLSTSVLSHTRHIDRLKTRIVAGWLEARGFTTRLIERRFTEDLRIESREPNILLCGVDNLPTRRVLEQPGFSFVIDAGLGASADDYDGFFIQTFTNEGRAANAFPDPTRLQTREERVTKNQAGYDSLGRDQCGIHWAADIVVGVPFVGVAVSCLVVAGVIRAIGGGSLFDTIGGNLSIIDLIDAYSSETTVRNPGYIAPKSIQ